jgi:hypothetical protein
MQKPPARYSESTTLFAGNRAVVINRQGCSVWANLFVNTGNGLDDADITLLRWSGKTIRGAIRWADKQLQNKADDRR